MKQFNWKQILPHVAAIVIFILVAVIYCQPVLEGKVVTESDLTQWKAMVHQMQQYKDVHGHFPLWSNSMFSGMPGYQIALEGHSPVHLSFFNTALNLGLPVPICFFFLLCLSLYFLAQVLRINPWISILASLAYAYASFSAVLVIAGHESELKAMGYVPFLLGALLLLYEGKYLWGTALTALFTSQLVGTDHLQITYYGLLMAGFMTLATIIRWVKAKQYKAMVLSLILAGAAGGVGLMANSTILMTTYDYSKETMRNGGLTLDTATGKVEKAKGLPVDYAFQWSYGPTETFTLMVPNIYGGASVPLPEDSRLAQTLSDQQQQRQLPGQLVQQLFNVFPSYWGAQEYGTSGPVYIGAVMTLLFIFSLFFVRNKNKWWLLAVTALAILMAWGKNFSAFNDFLFYYLPFYNKFRSPTMSLVIPQLVFPIMSAFCLQQLFYGENDKAFVLKAFKQTAITTGIVLLVLIGMYVSFSYKTARDTQIEEQLTQMAKGDNSLGRAIVSAAAADRQSLFGADLIRSIIFIVLAAGLLFLFIKGRIKTGVALVGLGILSFVDLISVDTRYLSYSRYMDADESTAVFNPSAADQQINQDTSYYRVLNTTTDTWQEAMTAYFHNSVGGYHPAKLALYQDLLTYQLTRQPINVQVLNMLNTKYVIASNPQNNQPVVERNPEALGPCWFVQTIEYVDGAAQAMKALNHFTAKDTAIVENAYKQDIPFTPQYDSTASISLVKNDNDLINYTSTSTAPGFAVFSEIFYDRGWKAYIDNKETPIVKCDYALRGLPIPAGKHDIRFEFQPAAYYTGEKLVAIAASIIILLMLAAFVQEYRVYTKKKKA